MPIVDNNVFSMTLFRASVITGDIAPNTPKSSRLSWFCQNRLMNVIRFYLWLEIHSPTFRVIQGYQDNNNSRSRTAATFYYLKQSLVSVCLYLTSFICAVIWRIKLCKSAVDRNTFVKFYKDINSHYPKTTKWQKLMPEINSWWRTMYSRSLLSAVRDMIIWKLCTFGLKRLSTPPKKNKIRFGGSGP